MNDSLIRHPATLVWTLLMLATGISWWMGAGGSAFFVPDIKILTAILIIIAFIKVRFVMGYFMEVRHAPLALRLACDVWIVGVGGAMIALYWFPAGS